MILVFFSMFSLLLWIILKLAKSSTSAVFCLLVFMPGRMICMRSYVAALQYFLGSGSIQFGNCQQKDRYFGTEKKGSWFFFNTVLTLKVQWQREARRVRFMSAKFRCFKILKSKAAIPFIVINRYFQRTFILARIRYLFLE